MAFMCAPQVDMNPDSRVLWSKKELESMQQHEILAMKRKEKHSYSKETEVRSEDSFVREGKFEHV